MKKVPFPNPIGLKELQHGKKIALGDVSTELPIMDRHIEEVLYAWESPEQWDGDCACVLKLKDGRLVAWETWYGPTGDGFCEDAYGGDADLYFANEENLKLLINTALSDQARRMCEIPEELWNK